MVKIIKSSYEIEEVDGHKILRNIEHAGKTCYQAEHTITKSFKSAEDFVKMIIKRGHESVLEHEKVSVRVICDRGISHEIIRHRIASYSQESTRYCNYKSKGEIKIIDIRQHLKRVVKNRVYQPLVIKCWEDAMLECQRSYNSMVDMGAPPELARSVLPNSLKTEIVMTMNLREWRHFFRLRAVNKRAHPQLREITVPMLKDFQKLIPVVFDDLEVEQR